jgi:hypothetical protein
MYCMIFEIVELLENSYVFDRLPREHQSSLRDN